MPTTKKSLKIPTTKMVVNPSLSIIDAPLLTGFHFITLFSAGSNAKAKLGKLSSTKLAHRI